MYESFFGFIKRPFLAAPTLDRYFPASNMEQAIHLAARAISRAEGPVALFGGTGLGKTMCCLRLADYFQGNLDVVMLSSSQLITRRALLQSLLYELNMPYRDLSEGELRLTLMHRLQPSDENQSEGLLLIVDEAQTLSPKLLDEIRLLTNIQRNGFPRVRLVLCGTIKLEESLASPHMDSLNQRIAARCYLTPLSIEETARYVIHKIEMCGVDHRKVITDDALDSIFRGSDGIPRLIDQLADQSLLLASSEGVRPIHAGLVGQAWGMLQQLPNPWSEPELIKSPPKSRSTVESANSHRQSESTIAAHERTVGHLLPFGQSETQGTSRERDSASDPLPAGLPPFVSLPRFDSAPAVSTQSGTVSLPSPQSNSHQVESPITNNYAVAPEIEPLTSSSLIEFGALDEEEDLSAEDERSLVQNRQDSRVDSNSFYAAQNQDVDSIAGAVGSDNETIEYRLAPEETRIESERTEKTRMVADLFGTDFDEEFNLPVQTSKGYNAYSGVAFGNLNHDVQSFGSENLLNAYHIDEASDFITPSAIGALPIEVTASEGEFRSTAVPTVSGNRLANAFGKETPRLESESQLLGDREEPISNITRQQAESLERQIEEEMRELVSDLNMSAMSFDPGQSIIASPGIPTDGTAGYLADSSHVSFAQMSREWNDGDYYTENAKSYESENKLNAPMPREESDASQPVSDDRDILVIEEDLDPPRVAKGTSGPAQSKLTLHPYVKLFSNLRTTS